MESDINVAGIVKGEERYLVLFDEQHREEAFCTLGKWASNPELSFNWYDAANIAMRLREGNAERVTIVEAAKEDGGV
jgi:hypothetical protein